MYEDAQEILEYLPIRKNTPENDYIDHLWQAFSTLYGGEAVARPFAVMPFHLLFMLSVQYKMLQVASAHKQATDLFFTGVGGRNKEQLLSEQRSVFDMALINERTIPDIFQLVEIDPKVLKKFKELVNDRNDKLAHAKGGIEQDLENKLAEYMAVLKSTQKSCLQINLKLADELLLEVKAGDNLGDFLEAHFLDSRLCPRDFGDVIGKMLVTDKLDFEQWEQIVNKGLELSNDQTISALHAIAENEADERIRLSAIRVLNENGEINEESERAILDHEL